MARYSVRIKRSAVKEIESLATPDRRRIVKRIEQLADDPRPVGYEKLSGDDKYRVRQGDYRIVYEIIDMELIVMIGSDSERNRSGGHSQTTVVSELAQRSNPLVGVAEIVARESV